MREDCHAAATELQTYLDGECGAALERAILAHLDRCPGCDRNEVPRRGPVGIAGAHRGPPHALLTLPSISIEERWMTRVLVTGGAGFIGSHLTDRLLD